MMKSVVLLSALAVVAGCSMKANSKSADLPKMTCEEFLSLRQDVQPRAVAYMDGFTRGKLKQQDVGEVDVDKQTEMLVVLCKQDPKESFWAKLRTHLPGATKQVQPPKMTCQEFVDLDQTRQPEVAYWLHGYDAATRTSENIAGQVDLERDVGVVVVACKQAPTESLWSKIKSKF